MNKLSISKAVFFLLCFSAPLFVRAYRLVPKTTLSLFGGYSFQDKVTFSDAYGYLRDGAHYGAALELFVHKNQSIGLLYQRNDTRIPLFTPDGLPLNAESDHAALNYIMAGSTRYVPLRGNVSVFGGADAGICILTNKVDYTVTKFAFDIKAGVKVQSSGRIGFKAYAQLFSITQAVGGGMYVGTGGAGLGISTYSSVWQFGLTGALTVDLL